MDLSNIKKIRGNSTKSKRVGRGFGSGKGGHTAGKGTKGQKARAGNSIPYGFEGGQVPLYKKMPQIGGFRNPTKKQITNIYLNDLNEFKEGSTVEPADLIEKRIIEFVPKHGIKILSNGEVTKKLKLKGFKASAAALEKLEKAGCTVEK